MFMLHVDYVILTKQLAFRRSRSDWHYLGTFYRFSGCCESERGTAASVCMRAVRVVRGIYHSQILSTLTGYDAWPVCRSECSDGQPAVSASFLTAIPKSSGSMVPRNPKSWSEMCDRLPVDIYAGGRATTSKFCEGDRHLMCSKQAQRTRIVTVWNTSTTNVENVEKWLLTVLLSLPCVDTVRNQPQLRGHKYTLVKPRCVSQVSRGFFQYESHQYVEQLACRHNRLQ